MENKRIGCSVNNCIHNQIEDCKCKLNSITIFPCNCEGQTPEENTACAMYQDKKL